jgi:hypothetical protein
LAGSNLIPLHGNLARFYDHISLRAPVLNNIAQDCDVLFAVGGDTVLLSRTPPSHSFDSVAAFCGTEGVFGELVKFDSMPEELMQLFVYVERALAQSVHRSVGAEHFEIEPVTVEGDDVREGFEFRDEVLCILLEPAPEAILFIPRNGDGYSESGDIRPAALHFVREAQRFNVEVDFAIK